MRAGGPTSCFVRDGRTTGTGRPEVHILTAASGYQAFRLRVGLGLRKVLPPGFALLGGHVRRRPVVLGLDRRGRPPRVSAVRLPGPRYPKTSPRAPGGPERGGAEGAARTSPPA